MSLLGHQNTDYHLMRERGSTCRSRITWFPTPGAKAVACSNAHPSMELARKDAWAAALRMGYEKPRWWQCWRWKENNLPMP